MRCPLDTPTLVHRLRHEKRNGTQQYGVRRGTPGAPFFSLLHALAPRNETNLLVALAGAATWPCAPYHPLAALHAAAAAAARRAGRRRRRVASPAPRSSTHTHTIANPPPPSPPPRARRRPLASFLYNAQHCRAAHTQTWTQPPKTQSRAHQCLRCFRGAAAAEGRGARVAHPHPSARQQPPFTRDRVFPHVSREKNQVSPPAPPPHPPPRRNTWPTPPITRAAPCALSQVGDPQSSVYSHTRASCLDLSTPRRGVCHPAAQT